jgi:hypothetical protein
VARSRGGSLCLRTWEWGWKLHENVDTNFGSYNNPNALAFHKPRKTLIFHTKEPLLVSIGMRMETSVPIDKNETPCTCLLQRLKVTNSLDKGTLVSMGTRMETLWEQRLKLQFPYPRMAMEATMRPCLLERLKVKLIFEWRNLSFHGIRHGNFSSHSQEWQWKPRCTCLSQMLKVKLIFQMKQP